MKVLRSIIKSPEPPPVEFEEGIPRRDQFPVRARSMFYARLFLDALGIMFLFIPKWSDKLLPFLYPGLGMYLLLLTGHVVSFMWIGHRGDKIVYFLSLIMDIFGLAFLIIVTGGLASPLMAGHIVYAVFFAVLYPSPLAILPPLLLLPVMAKISQLIGTEVPGRDLLLLLWYSALDLIIVYVVVYLDLLENARFREAVRLEREKRRLDIIDERQRIAREMHDGLGAMLSGIKIQAEFISELYDGNDEITEEIDLLHSRTSLALDEIRRTVRIMREDFDLASSLDELVQNMSRIWKYEVDFHSSRLDIKLTGRQQLNIYRIIQESLTNAGKHAQADTVIINLIYLENSPQWVNEQLESPGGFELSISDNGRGISGSLLKEGHYGMLHLEERAKEMSGEFDVISDPGKGTEIRIWFPAPLTK
ncbi:sensor histidine kinase [Myxococcota bacterium]|nr:sensor histidine kinase [Myxococcota bacterium]MBU1382077.1 sensor histidine kinase [Myxococcota bacterium]MBU1496191.1 sensor histidine kinase [Myxococcota bacterium]